MQLCLDNQTAKYQVKGYKPGAIQVNDDWLFTSIVISASELIHPWSPNSITEINHSHIDSLISMSPEIILFGSGSKMEFIDPKLLISIQQQGIGVECMDTKAACRTFNILLSENRHALAALLIK